MLQSFHPGFPSFCDLPHSTWSNLLFSQGREKTYIYRALNFVLFWAVAVVGFALRAGKEGLDAGTKLVPVLSSLPHLLCMPQVFELVTWQSLYSWLGIELLVLYSWLGDYDWTSSCVGMVRCLVMLHDQMYHVSVVVRSKEATSIFSKLKQMLCFGGWGMHMTRKQYQGLWHKLVWG